MSILLSVLSLGNIIFSSAIIIVAFSLFLYLFANNIRNSVARSFSGLLAFLTIIYIGDVFLQRVETFPDAVIWLKFKWIGLAFIPAAYLHFSDALLRSTNAYSPRRRVAVVLSYLTSAAFLLLVALTTFVVQDGFFSPPTTQFEAGPLFPLFGIFFFALTGWGFTNTRRARARCLTSTTRRRMTYLEIAFFAPALGVFPYLIIASFPATFSPPLLLLIALLTKIGIAAMITVMAYTVAYQGALSPDRVIKHNLIHYLLRGPLVATAVVGLMFFVPTVERWFGLTRETIWYAIIIGAIVALELAINLAKPWIDKLVFWGDREDLERIQEIDKRLLTTSDLRQLLENILSAACDLLQVQTGFVVAPRGGEWKIETFAGSREQVRHFIAQSIASNGVNGQGFVARDGFWLWHLRAQSRDEVIGVLGVAARAPEPDLTEREQKLIAALVRQAELALEDRQLQQGVFAAFEQLTSEIELLQRARGKPRYVGTMATERVEDEQIASPDFHRAVKDALDHYWGGPKLTESPLLQLHIVQNSLDEYEGNPVRALRGQIAHAIETLKPDGERSLTAPEWLLYNILEFKVIQGMKVREIALKLAMSESDLYRKQRIAIQEVAKTLATMEEQSQEKENATDAKS
ncbi:MAG: histidine kinase N-terminal 7TM domain-containing protein [Chloroflexota bacterium]